MTEVFLFVNTHVLTAEEPPIQQILLFSYRIGLFAIFDSYS